MAIFGGKVRDQNPAWQPEAEQALKKVPRMVRPLARRKINEQVLADGRDLVTLADYQQAEARFKSVMGNKSEAELKKLMPAENRPGVEMVLIETCRNELSACPNVLLKTEPWREAVQEVVQRNNFSERLRARVDEAKILFHHKLKISISGCPNGCSRPQIADIGLVGFVRPTLAAPDDCVQCGACVVACPDQAVSLVEGLPFFDTGRCQGCLKCSQACAQECISLSQPGVRVLLGGKLGRHPHLAQPVCELNSIDELKEKLRAWLEDYLESSAPGERFSVWWQRKGGLRP